MSDQDELLAVIDGVYQAGASAGPTPLPFEAITRLLGATGITFEVIDKRENRYREFHHWGLPGPAETDYIDQYAALNPRIPHGLAQQSGSITWDYQHLDEAAMSRHPYFAEFLPRIGLRYCSAAVMKNSPDEFAVAVIHRSRKQGHPEPRELDLLRALAPHLSRANEMRGRLAAAPSPNLEEAFHWLADGVAGVDWDGRLRFRNAAFAAIEDKAECLKLVNGIIEFQHPEAQRMFARSMAALRRFEAGMALQADGLDFIAPRQGRPSLIASVRPSPTAGSSVGYALLFLRDPSLRSPTAARLLRITFGLTHAEASLAAAIQAGTSLADYAAETQLSLNTVYTHLRHIKEKSGAKGISELARMLGRLRPPAVGG